MKMIKKYLFIAVVMIVALFAANQTTVKAEGEEPSEVLDKVVINPNSSTGKPSNVFVVVETLPPTVEGGEPTQTTREVQFTRVRNITVSLNLSDSEKELYDTTFEVCEVLPSGTNGVNREQEVCVTHDISKEKNTLQLRGVDDGEKTLKVYLFNATNKEHSKNRDFVVYEKTICLDTTGPIISLTGGEYIFLPLGTKYTEGGYSCEDDSLYTSGACIVDAETPNINMSKKGYQYIRYTATDFLGNETNVVRKVMVEQEAAAKDYTSWFIGIGAVVCVILIVGYKVIKDKEKNKNQSVL